MRPPRPPPTQIIRSAVNLGPISLKIFPGRYPCPECGERTWTLPWNDNHILWRCVKCHVSFEPKEEKMNLKVARRLTEALINAGIGVQLRETYSGRGMFGATTPALVLDPADLVEMGRIAGSIGLKSPEIPKRRDNMGANVVVY